MKVLTEEKSLELAEMLLRNDKDIKEKLEKKINSIKISGEEYDDTELIAKIKEIENEMNGKANKTEIPNVDNFLSEIPSEYVTESELKIAIANAQLGGDDSEIDLSNYVTTLELGDSLSNKANLEHTHTIDEITNYPEINMSNYYTKTEIDDLIENVEVSDGNSISITSSEVLALYNEVKNEVINNANNS